MITFKKIKIVLSHAFLYNMYLINNYNYIIVQYIFIANNCF